MHSLIIAKFRNYNPGFHVVFARFCSSYACGVGGVGVHSLIIAAFRNYNPGFHVVFARFCSSILVGW